MIGDCGVAEHIVAIVQQVNPHLAVISFDIHAVPLFFSTDAQNENG